MRKSNTKFYRAVLILAVLLALAMLHLYVYTQNIALKFAITDLKIKLQELRSINRGLGSSVAREESPAKIDKVANQEMQMTYPPEVIYLPASREANP